MERLFTCSVFQVKGLVLEHGSRYPDMKRQWRNVLSWHAMHLWNVKKEEVFF
jgi:hypothetical protein